MASIFYLSLLLNLALLIVLSVNMKRLTKCRTYSGNLENQNIQLNANNADFKKTLELKRDHEKIQTDELIKLKQSNQEKENALLEQSNLIDQLRATIQQNEVHRVEASFTIEEQQSRIEQLIKEKMKIETKIKKK